MLRSLSVALVLLWSLCAAAADLRVHFLDVGQGDSALIISPTGKKVLIDGGGEQTGRRLALRLRAIDRGPLDLMLLTHPHADHMGGLATVVKFVGLKQFMEPGFQHPSAMYDALIALVRKKAGTVLEPRLSGTQPVVIDLGGGAQLEVLWPRRPVDEFLRNTRSDANSNSIVARLSYGRTAVLFTGDAEPEAEERLLRIARPRLEATVLKVPHHGSRYSSTRDFLRAVSPAAAVISCGTGNDYRHPAQETLNRLDDVGARVFRTDQDGEVLLTSDGATVTLTSERGGTATLSGRLVSAELPRPAAEPSNVTVEVSAHGSSAVRVASAGTGAYFASRRSDVFHKAGCDAEKTIKEDNVVHFESRDSASRDRQPAKDCNP